MTLPTPAQVEALIEKLNHKYMHDEGCISGPLIDLEACDCFPGRRGKEAASALAALRDENAALRKKLDGWQPLADAPMYVYGRDALVGEYVAEVGWKKVSVWEREWTREDIVKRGATHGGRVSAIISHNG